MDQNILHHSKEKISYLQIIGFIVILAGLAYLFDQQLMDKLNGKVISIDFFTIMLGIVFAFPDLLQDPAKGLSTMRIVVFMVINVFCILALRIGWDAHSLRDLGVDQYWMGIIAFTFGAKATQSYFESKLAAVTAGGGCPNPDPGGGTGTGAGGDDQDGCGGTPGPPTADADLPVSKGGMVS